MERVVSPLEDVCERDKSEANGKRVKERQIDKLMRRQSASQPSSQPDSQSGIHTYIHTNSHTTKLTNSQLDEEM